MIDGLDDFKVLMKRLGEGDATAAQLVVDRYGLHVTRAIRTRKMQVLYGTEDCMQSVWGSIFSDVGRVSKIETPEHLMQYLAKVAGNKLGSSGKSGLLVAKSGHADFTEGVTTPSSERRNQHVHQSFVPCVRDSGLPVSGHKVS